jgi:hypothetical protein
MHLLQHCDRVVLLGVDSDADATSLARVVAVDTPAELMRAHPHLLAHHSHFDAAPEQPAALPKQPAQAADVAATAGVCAASGAQSWSLIACPCACVLRTQQRRALVARRTFPAPRR